MTKTHDLEDILDAVSVSVFEMLKAAKEILKGITATVEEKCIKAARFTDCADLRSYGYVQSDEIYCIWPRYLKKPIHVVCDMDTEGGGWTVIQRRGYFKDMPQDFNQSWFSYSVGFGNLKEDFWLGNDIIFALTNQKEMELRVELEDFSGKSAYAQYSSFLVLSERRKYQMFVTNYTGDAGDSLSAHSEMYFSTKNVDNDNSPDRHCGFELFCGWWFTTCHPSNLNAIYYRSGKPPKHWQGIVWNTFGGYEISLKKTEIKIRPAKFPVPM
ncbi:techylectin-5B-like [Limulus polyphemus]|uniref:Techylectin-5B-like n=1 Tax=Limulus polyphemus TaxID=6850 RepID=A0ABM1C4L2_LIMPO|nr:techylectin-5B-like [Limulus polyphemus]